MSNTGYFCILISEDYRTARYNDLIAKFKKYVESHATLHNLKFGSNENCRKQLISGRCDDLTPALMKEFFFQGEIPKDIRVFVINSIYGESWEEVT